MVITNTLAGFGLAFQLIKLLSGPTVEMKPVGLVQVQTRAARLAAMQAVLLWSGCLLGLLSLMSYTRLGTATIEGLHRTGPVVGRVTHEAMTKLCWWPLLDGLALLHAGILLRHGRHIGIVSAASMADIGAQIVAVMALLWFQPQDPLFIPVACAYMGVCARLALLLGGYYWLVHAQLPARTVGQPNISVTDILRFAWPLALINTCQRISRPLVNLFVSRSADGPFGVAVLTVCYPLAHIPYGWLNELKAVTPAFLRTPAAVRASPLAMRRIRVFGVTMLTVSCAIMVATMWTPLHQIILRQVVGVTDEIATASSMPLIVFTFFSFPVAVRAYFTGWLTAQQETQRLAPSAIIRVLAVLLGCLVLPYWGASGAATGVGALLAGFTAEAAAVLFIARRFSSITPASVTLDIIPLL